MASNRSSYGSEEPNVMVNSYTGFQAKQLPVTSAELLRLSNMNYTAYALGSEALQNPQQVDTLQVPATLALPCSQTEENHSRCQNYGFNACAERRGSESSLTSGSSSPDQSADTEQFPSNQEAHSYESKLKGCPTEELRRHSTDDVSVVGHYTRPVKDRTSRLHPYSRQFSEGLLFQDIYHSPLSSPAYKNLESLERFEEPSPPGSNSEMNLLTQSIQNVSTGSPWSNATHYGNTACTDSHIMDSELKYQISLLRVPQQDGQPRRFGCQPQAQQAFRPGPSDHQYPSGNRYPVSYAVPTHYPFQKIAPHSSHEPQAPLYPKPIYSYSILIFMALKNSKTGSLPVSEIYNFMTEHFPYFKTAPDGWKNSVRHNLSLNKCFEKVENKSGSASRKGCLWALNPNKVEKMQEELQKWKRKDPVAIRKAMAKPEELDRLIGARLDKPRSATVVSSNTLSLPSSTLSGQMSAQPPSQSTYKYKSLHSATISRSSYAIQTVSDLPQAGTCMSLLPRCHGPSFFEQAGPQNFQQIPSGFVEQIPSAPQILFPHSEPHNQLKVQPDMVQESPVPAQTPPTNSLNMVKERSMAKTIQDTFIEGDLSIDIDALNPSLTDFELQGNLWEELKDDSLTLDSLISLAMYPASTCFVPSHLSSCPMEGSSSNELDLPNSAEQRSMADLHITSIYSTFTDFDTPGSKPIALI